MFAILVVQISARNFSNFTAGRDTARRNHAGSVWAAVRMLTNAPDIRDPRYTLEPPLNFIWLRAANRAAITNSCPRLVWRKLYLKDFKSNAPKLHFISQSSIIFVYCTTNRLYR